MATQGNESGEEGVRAFDEPRVDPAAVKSQREFEVGKARAEVKLNIDRGSWVGVMDTHGAPVALDDSGQASVSFTLPKGHYRAYTDGEIKSLRTDGNPAPDPLESASLAVHTDAPDVHVVDGIGEIPADGQSHCTFTVTKLDPGGEPAKGEDIVYLRTTGGTLKSSAGARGKVIREIKLSAGKGKFVLVADTQPRLVEVTLLGENIEPQRVPLEFVPR